MAECEKRHFHYLKQLTDWGYAASAVEKIILVPQMQSPGDSPQPGTHP